MNSIWKFPLEMKYKQTIVVPATFKLLCVQTQNDAACLWAEVDTASGTCTQEIFIVATGCGMVIPKSWVYVGTVQLCPFVWHVYMEKRGS